MKKKGKPRPEPKQDPEPDIEHDLEKSTQLAHNINLIKFALCQIDFDYAKSAVKRMRNDIGNYDAMAALNRDYMPEKSELMALKVSALEDIIGVAEKLQQCTQLQEQVNASEKQMKDLSKLFNF